MRDRGVVDVERLGARKATSAAMAPGTVDALGGIIRGRGRGSVYGTRSMAIARSDAASVWLPWCALSWGKIGGCGKRWLCH